MGSLWSKRTARRNHETRIRRRGRSAAVALLWGLLFFLAIQAGIFLLMDTVLPGMRDPAFGVKLARVKKLQARFPERPMVLVLGSSRSMFAIWPEVFASCHTADGQVPLAYNFSLTASGTFEEYLCLRQLLDRGVRPRWLLVEVLPALLNRGEFSGLETCRLRWQDVGLLPKYFVLPKEWRKRWLEARLVPGFSNRFSILYQLAPRWVPPGVMDPCRQSLHFLGSYGYVSPPVDAATYKRGLARAHLDYWNCLKAFCIRKEADGALRELLELCRREGIKAALYMTPEGTDFRSWHSPSARAQIAAYLTALSKEFGIPVADTRTWMPDSAFLDSHHLLYPVALDYSRRFARQVLQPFLLDQPCQAPISSLDPSPGVSAVVHSQ